MCAFVARHSHTIVKIFYVAPKYDRGDPLRGLSFEHINFYDTFCRLDKGTHNVVYFASDIAIKSLGKEKTGQQLLAAVLEKKPDICFFSMIDDELSPETIRSITNTGHTTLGWFSDDPWRFDNYSKYYAPSFSWVSTTDESALPKYKKIGVTNAVYIPCAANDAIFKLMDVLKDVDVSFIGSRTAQRYRIIKELKRNGINIVVRGSGWTDGRISAEEVVNIICRSKISLNFNQSAASFGIRPLARLFFKRNVFTRSLREIHPDFQNFFSNLREWRQKRKPQLKARTFEVPACGTMLLTHNSCGVGRYYKIGREIDVYDSITNLMEKIRHYLNHDELRERIAQAGYHRTIRDHTYAARFANLFSHILKK